MRVPILIIILLPLITISVDLYIYRVLAFRCKKHSWLKITQAVSGILFNLFIFYLLLCSKKSGTNAHIIFLMWSFFTILAIYVPKIIFVLIDLIAKIPQIFGKQRLKWLSITGACVAILLSITLWWGALVNRYSIQLVTQDIVSQRLPDSFSGLKIVQISDLHVGSFGNDTSFVAELVDKINTLSPDIIVFTGDIVNRRTDEIEPFIPTLSRLTAPLGVYSIKGNHDYGDYSQWDSQAQYLENIQRLTQIQHDMGWNLLDNTTAWLVNGKDSIAIIGVENIGDPPFKVYGDLNKAYPGNLADNKFKILLSHNPSHWDTDIKDNPANAVDLTLSGHTHAMQISIGGKSPASLRYPQWGGLYSDSIDHKLYVNIGAGEVGLPMRIGAKPEITILILSSGSQEK